MSGDKENEYFSDGLAEEIINALAKSRDSKSRRVPPPSRSRARNRTSANRGSAGRAHILEGSVRRAGNRIRVTAQLINAADGYHLWSERYDREMTDIFAVQDEIAAAIAGTLK